MAEIPRDDTAGAGKREALPAALEKAYRRAIYEVEAEAGSIRLAVGRRSRQLDRLLAARSVKRAAFLSAANPGSRPLAETENRERHECLLLRLAELGYAALPAESRDASGAWREASLLVLGVSEDAALSLAREFGQAALLVAEPGGAVRLVAVPI
jgi:hypothetical protein